MIDSARVLQIIESQGPVIPRDVMKQVGGDTFIIGAVLSQLKDSGKIRVSNTKIGGSPVYYVPAQSPKLQALYKFLGHVEKKAYDQIKEKHVLRDVLLEPAVRVAMRSIRDFAKPVEVIIREKKEIFWKWYLLPNQEVEPYIRELLKSEVNRPGAAKEPDPPKTLPAEPKAVPGQVTEKKEEKIIEEQEKHDADEFENEILNYFRNKDIEVIETEVLKKNSEIDWIIKLPSVAGKLTFYCKAKKKKKYNDADLSQAYIKAESHKLPVLFITTGEMTKKASKMLEQEFRNINVVKL